MKKFTKVWNSVWTWIEYNLLLIILLIGSYLITMYTGDGGPLVLAVIIGALYLSEQHEES